MQKKNTISVPREYVQESNFKEIPNRDDKVAEAVAIILLGGICNTGLEV